jgi:hypothetical protein
LQWSVFTAIKVGIIFALLFYSRRQNYDCGEPLWSWILILGISEAAVILRRLLTIVIIEFTDRPEVFRDRSDILQFVFILGF